MSKYNVYYTNGDRVVAEKGSYTGKEGTVHGMEYYMFSDAEFLIKFDEIEYPVWVDSWNLWYAKKKKNTLIDLYKMKPADVFNKLLTS